MHGEGLGRVQGRVSGPRVGEIRVGGKEQAGRWKDQERVSPAAVVVSVCAGLGLGKSRW